MNGAEPVDAVDPVDAELSNGGSSEAVASRDQEADEVGIAEAGSPEVGRTEAGDAVDGAVYGIDWTEMVVVVDVAAVDATDIPGGGDATTSGSSISSSGKSGSCSSKGETGTPAKPLGAVGLMIVAEADGAAAAVGTAADDAARVGTAADMLTVAPSAAGAAIHMVAVVPSTVGIAGDALTVVAAAGADGFTDALAAVDVRDEFPATVGTGVPAGAPARTGVVALAVGAFAADGVPPGATPTGLEIFLAAWPAESEDGALRVAAPAAPKTLEVPVAPIETPTGREVTPGVFPDGEDAVPGL